MAADPVETLAALPMLAGIEHKHLQRMARSFRERDFRSGDQLTTQGERGGFFFVVANGSADVLINGEKRAELGPGDPFGEMSLIDDEPRSATIIATSDVHCLTMTPWEFRAFVEEHPEVAWNLLRTMVRRLRAVEAQLG